VSDLIFTHVDFAPTFLGLAGAPVPNQMQGTDLSRAILEGGQGPDSAFFQIFGPYNGDGTEEGWRGVRTRRHMYARYRSRPWVLYDIQRDPDQLNNLAGKPEAAALQKEMEKRLAAWMQKTGDSWQFDWTFPVEDRGRLYRHRTFYTVNEYLEWLKQNPE
jgi:arylsulfatase A-like enzyme